ncbi:DMT family transporter [Actinoallomurus liliacearum]|uniref:DMT family transporter n=1 Tax=Actinoallomurus liliacearum TaxID=1080073 RepID=UPI0031ECBD77
MTLVSERPVRSRSVRGPALCLAAATGFGLSVVFAKEADRAGTGVESMLAIRFAIAAVVCWAIVARRRPAFPTRRALLACAGLGLVGYAAQSALYFTSLTRIDGGLAALLLYTYPALVTLVAVARRREHLDAKRAAALICSAAGLALLLGSGHLGGTDLAGGITLALGSAGLYALYLTVADGLPHDLDLFLTSAIVCTGAALSLTIWCAVTGSADLPDRPEGWLWVMLLAVVSTVIPFVCTFAGLRAVGASTVAILSGAEPIVTAASTALIYGERLGPGQLLGGTAVLAAVALLSSGRGQDPQLRAA